MAHLGVSWAHTRLKGCCSQRGVGLLEPSTWSPSCAWRRLAPDYDYYDFDYDYDYDCYHYYCDYDYDYYYYDDYY